VSAMLAFSCSISNVVRMRKVVSLRRIALPLGVCLTTSALMITLFAGAPTRCCARCSPSF
jgi:hypothetical protein